MKSRTPWKILLAVVFLGGCGLSEEDETYLLQANSDLIVIVENFMDLFATARHGQLPVGIYSYAKVIPDGESELWGGELVLNGEGEWSDGGIHFEGEIDLVYKEITMYDAAMTGEVHWDLLIDIQRYGSFFEYHADGELEFDGQHQGKADMDWTLFGSSRQDTPPRYEGTINGNSIDR